MTLRVFAFNKLIRDKMYKSMISKGAKVSRLKISSREELVKSFKSKLLEEVEEVTNAQNDIELTEELADCVEVIQGFLKAIEISKENFEKIRKRKYDSRGGFDTPIMVESIAVCSNETDPNYYKFIIDYCMSSPLKYPEIKNTEKDKKQNK
jgi:predicted house-cleaning noncanonical NTP pyrophosphatase (MazG superfamily)